MPSPVLRAPLLGISLLLSGSWWVVAGPSGEALAQASAPSAPLAAPGPAAMPAGMPMPMPTAMPMAMPGAPTASPAASPAAGPMASPLAVPAASGRAAQASSALVEERTREAALRILRALQARDADAGYRLFSPDLRRMTSVAMVQKRLDSLPRLLSWKLGPVVPGQDFSTVSAALRTAAGPRQLEMMIDANGQLDGYHFDVADQPAEAVARQFLEQLSQGRYVSAASFLSPEMQSEIPASALQLKWQRLQRSTGDFVAIRRVFRSERSADQKLVLVRTEFRRLTDTLFVILDNRNQVIGVDFPTDAFPQAGAAAPAR